ncbi:FkbM family methyltransferase [candidate division KSB1 bacterium]|nr:FkbM family methyltransferase [candidate division KSB1 bacterium]
MILNELFGFFPECYLKNIIRCLYRNYFRKHDFKIYYRKNYYQVVFDDFTLKFYDNPYVSILIPVKGYLKKYSIQRGDIVIDAGAYVGIFNLIASKMVGDEGRVIAFEPNRENYKKLLNNIKLNDVTNVTVLKKGLWSKNTKLQLNNEYPGVSTFLFDRTKSEHVVFVPTVRLDDEVKKLGINTINFIKMDIEGAEIEAIKGCKKILKHNDVKLAIASYHIVNGQKSCFKLEKLLSKLGYQTETSFPEHLTTYANK